MKMEFATLLEKEQEKVYISQIALNMLLKKQNQIKYQIKEILNAYYNVELIKNP